MKNYPKKHSEYVSLMKKLGSKIPETMQAFSKLHKVSSKDDALTKKQKS